MKPYLLEFKTYRYLGHSKSDQRKYRTKDEEEDMKKNHDAIERQKKYMMDKGMITQEEFEELDKKIEKEIEDAAEKSKESRQNHLCRRSDEFMFMLNRRK